MKVTGDVVLSLSVMSTRRALAIASEVQNFNLEHFDVDSEYGIVELKIKSKVRDVAAFAVDVGYIIHGNGSEISISDKLNLIKCASTDSKFIPAALVKRHELGVMLIMQVDKAAINELKKGGLAC